VKSAGWPEEDVSRRVLVMNSEQRIADLLYQFSISVDLKTQARFMVAQDAGSRERLRKDVAFTQDSSILAPV